MILIDSPLWPVAKTSVKVNAFIFRPYSLNRGAIYIQLIINPDKVAGNNQRAGKPHKYAAPLTPSRVQAEDELAEALKAATQGPSLPPPRK